MDSPRTKPGPRAQPQELLFHPDERCRLDPASPVPLYHQMQSAILDRLKAVDGQFKRLPTEMDLIRIFDVSRATVRKVTESLAAQGLIQRRRSLGTSIVSRSVSEDLGRLTSFSEQMAARGLTISTQLISAAIEPASPFIREKLNLKPRAEVLAVRRLRGTSQVFPFVFLQSFLPARLKIDPKEDFHGSLYTLMESKYNLQIEWAEEEISAANASDEEAKRLSIKPGTTVLVMERLTFGRSNEPLEFVRATYIPEHYKFRAKLKR